MKIYLIFKVDTDKPLTCGQTITQANGAQYEGTLLRAEDFEAWSKAGYGNGTVLEKLHGDGQSSTWKMVWRVFEESTVYYLRLFPAYVWEPKA